MAPLRNDSISGAVPLQEQSFDDCSYAGETSCNTGTVMPLLLIKYLGHSLRTYRMPLKKLEIHIIAASTLACSREFPGRC